MSFSWCDYRLVSDSMSAAVVMSHGLGFILLCGLRFLRRFLRRLLLGDLLRLRRRLLLGDMLRLRCRLMLRYRLWLRCRLMLRYRLRFRRRLMLHNRLRFRSVFVLYDRFRRRLMVHDHMLRRRLMMHNHGLGCRNYNRLAGDAACVVAQFQSQMIAAAESYHYYAGHQYQFEGFLIHCSGEQGVVPVHKESAPYNNFYLKFSIFCFFIQSGGP